MLLKSASRFTTCMRATYQPSARPFQSAKNTQPPPSRHHWFNFEDCFADSLVQIRDAGAFVSKHTLWLDALVKRAVLPQQRSLGGRIAVAWSCSNTTLIDLWYLLSPLLYLDIDTPWTLPGNTNNTANQQHVPRTTPPTSHVPGYGYYVPFEHRCDRSLAGTSKAALAPSTHHGILFGLCSPGDDRRYFFNKSAVHEEARQESLCFAF